MARNPLGNVLEHVRAMVAPPTSRGEADGVLLQAFLTRDDQSAFTSLVKRHGRLVLDVCRRVLQQEQDAEDAFQATFLFLARKASSLQNRNSLGGYLHEVARRMALNARRASARRRGHERQAT